MRCIVFSKCIILRASIGVRANVSNFMPTILRATSTALLDTSPSSLKSTQAFLSTCERYHSRVAKLPNEVPMTKPDTPFPKHWLYYIVLKYAIIAAAVLITLFTVYRLFWSVPA